MVTAIRHTEAALGSGVIIPAACELLNIPVARKSVVAARSLASGHVLTAYDLAIGNREQAWNRNYSGLIGRRLQRQRRRSYPVGSLGLRLGRFAVQSADEKRINPLTGPGHKEASPLSACTVSIRSADRKPRERCSIS